MGSGFHLPQDMPRHIVSSGAFATEQPRDNPRLLPGPEHGLSGLDVHPVEASHQPNGAKAP
eukprot:2470040-Prorocentrum_lima.AAC.1